MIWKKAFQQKLFNSDFFKTLLNNNSFLSSLQKNSYSKEIECLKEFNFLCSENSDELYKIICKKISMILEAKKCAIYILDSEFNELILKKSINTETINLGLATKIKDYENKNEINKILKTLFMEEDFIFSYIKLNKKILGLIAISQKTSLNNFNVKDNKYLNICCNQVGYVIANKNLYNEICSKINLEFIINKINDDIRNTLTIDSITNTFEKEITPILNVTDCHIINFSLNTKEFKKISKSPIYKELKKSKTIIHINDTSLNSLVLDEIVSGSLFPDIIQAKSLLITPLIYNDELIGMILIIDKQNSHKWKGEEIILMERISKSLSISIYQVNFLARIKNLACNDELTGLANRRVLLERLFSETERAFRNNHVLSFALFDIDYFKKFNDNWGHLAGDQILREIGNIVRKNIRKSDIAARYGGEEFAVILPETNIDKAFDLLDRLRKKISEHNFYFKGNNLSVSISAGVIEINPSDFNYSETKNFINQCIDEADSLLYKAKGAGRNKVYMP